MISVPSCIGAFNEGHRKYLVELKQIMPVCLQQNPPGFVHNGQAYHSFGYTLHILNFSV